MGLLQRILDCNEEEIDTIMQQAIEEANSNSDKVEELGFVWIVKLSNAFKGFIPLNTRIKFRNDLPVDYNMQTTDFMYEFAHSIKQNNINSTSSLIKNIEEFIDLYFGMPGDEDIRDTILEERANNTTTDEEYWTALENSELGYFKNKEAAMCTERSALAQQILSLFGIESYYCMGCVDLGHKQEPHCFNIVKRVKDYAVLDYSCIVPEYNKDGTLEGYCPFVGLLSNEEFKEFINNGTIKSFSNYEYIDDKKVTTMGKRSYVVGVHEIDKKKIKPSIELGEETLAEQEDTVEKKRVVDDISHQVNLQKEKRK